LKIRILKVVQYIAILWVINLIAFWIFTPESVLKIQNITITNRIFSIIFILIWLLIAIWAGYYRLKEVFIAAIIHTSLPLVILLQFNFSVYIIKATLLYMSIPFWMTISQGIGFITIKVLKQYNSDFLYNYFSLIMLILFVVVYNVGKKYYNMKKSKQSIDLKL
jgi:hypothetical protein